MVTKLKDDKGAREYFREQFCIDAIAKVEKDDVNYSYKGVISNYPKDPLSVERHLDTGYEFVYSDDKLKDDRKYTPDNDSESKKLRPSFVTKTSKDGYEFVLMRILKTKEQENQRNEEKKRQAYYLKATKGTKVSGDSTHIKMVLPSGETNNNLGDN